MHTQETACVHGGIEKKSIKRRRSADMINFESFVLYLEAFTVVCERLVFVLEYPVFYLYLNGPKVFGLWQGLTFDHICASFTGVPSSHWLRNTNECNILITKSFRSWLMVPYVLAYCVVVCHIITVVWFTCKRRCMWRLSRTNTLSIDHSDF